MQADLLLRRIDVRYVAGWTGWNLEPHFRLGCSFTHAETGVSRGVNVTIRDDASPEHVAECLRQLADLVEGKHR